MNDEIENRVGVLNYAFANDRPQPRRYRRTEEFTVLILLGAAPGGPQPNVRPPAAAGRERKK